MGQPVTNAKVGKGMQVALMRRVVNALLQRHLMTGMP